MFKDSETHFRHHVAEKAIKAVEEYGKGVIYTAEDAGIVIAVKQQLAALLRKYQQGEDSTL